MASVTSSGLSASPTTLKVAKALIVSSELDFIRNISEEIAPPIGHTSVAPYRNTVIRAQTILGFDLVYGFPKLPFFYSKVSCNPVWRIVSRRPQLSRAGQNPPFNR